MLLVDPSRVFGTGGEIRPGKLMRWCSSCVSIYTFTASTWDALTENAPYPALPVEIFEVARLRLRSHLDDSRLSPRSRSATEMVLDSRQRM